MMPQPTCVAPGMVDGRELFDWAEGRPTPKVESHIAVCAACHTQALEYSAIIARLSRRWTDVLIDYVADLLPPEERARVARHLLICRRCSDEVAELRADLAEPAVPPSGVPLLERLAVTIATLLHPTAAPPAYAGTRGGMPGLQPPTYAAGDARITIHVASVGGGLVAVRGMVLSPQHPPAALVRSRVDLLCGDRIVATEDLTEYGHFTLSGIAPGEYALRVSFPDRAVLIPALDLTT